jgi:hypothetical protein
MKLVAKMARFVLDQEEIERRRGSFSYSEVQFLPNPEDFSSLIVGLENRHKTFVTESHFRGNDNKGFYVLVFSVVDMGEDEKPTDFRIQYFPKKDEREKTLKYDPTYNIYFDEPNLKKDKGRWTYSNKLKDAVFGSVSTGNFYLNVYREGLSTPINDSPYKISVLPSSLSLENFKEMVDDILAIRRELIMAQNTAKQSIQTTWHHALNEIEEALNNITKPMKEINAQPKVKLEESYVKKSLRNIKKFNGRTVMNLLLNKGANKYVTSHATESTDIYENQMILYTLTKLNKYVEESDVHFKNKLTSRKREIDKQITKLLKQYKKKDLDELEEFIRYFQYNKEGFCRDILKTVYEHSSVSKQNTVEITIYVDKKSFQIDKSMTFFHDKLVASYKTEFFDRDHRFWGLDYNRGHYYFVDNPNNRIAIKGRRAEIHLTSGDYRQHLLLHHFLSENTTLGLLEIHAVVEKNNSTDSDPLKERPTEGGRFNNTYDYPLKIVELKRINDMTSADFKGKLEELVSLFSYYGSLGLTSETLKQIDTLRKKKNNHQFVIHEDNQLQEQITRISNKIKYFRKLSFLKGVTQRKLSWRLTQVYINDRYYSRIWENLRSLDKRYEFTSDFNEEDIVVKKTDELYEYWILIHLLLHLKNTGWTFTSGYSIKEAIDILVKDKTSWSLEGCTFSLQHNGNHFRLSNDIAEQHSAPIHIEKIVMDVHYNRKISGLKPDYAFEVKLYAKHSKEDQETKVYSKWFYLDAKYRNYEEQNQLDSFYYDINDVAIGKYLNQYRRKGQPSSAAFLIHTDTNYKYDFFGGFHDDIADSSLHDVFDPYSNPFSDDPFAFYQPAPIHTHFHRNPRHMYGGFSCIPGETENLKTFVKMLLEYHFIEHMTPSICWDCGSTNTFIERREISPNNYKYYITCNDCSEFWVRNHCKESGHKLVKHIVNYHKEEHDEYPWYVKCPVCNNVHYDEEEADPFMF